MRIYAIGDIHGQLRMLQTAHERIEADRKTMRDFKSPVVHLGDLVDRGYDSKGVIQFLIDGVAAGKPWITIRGNHDQLFLDFLDPDRSSQFSFGSWTSDGMGGAMTMASYGVVSRVWTTGKRARQELAEAVPEAHKAFLEGLPYYHQTKDLLFVHAGIRPGLAIEEQSELDLMWIRGEFLRDARNHGRLVVHGHTPIDKSTHYGNRINLDTGAGYGMPLTCAVFEGRRCWILGSQGREPLPRPS